MNYIRAIWHWRAFIFENVRRNFLARYAGSSLGFFWHILQALAQIAVYALIFSELMRSRLPGSSDPLSYSIYLCAGVLPWQLFQELVTQGSSLFVDNSNILKKSGFPRICLPSVLVCSALLNFVIVFAFFMIWLLWSGRPPIEPGLLVLPLFLLVGIGASIGVFVGLLNVFLRDLGQVVAIVLPFWFWLTPIVWPLEAMPEGIRALLAYNPLAAPIQYLHAAFLGRGTDILPSLSYAFGFMFFTSILAILSFSRLQGSLVDEL